MVANVSMSYRGTGSFAVSYNRGRSGVNDAHRLEDLRIMAWSGFRKSPGLFRRLQMDCLD